MSSFGIFVVAVCLVQHSLGACLGSPPISRRWPAAEIAVPVAEYFRPSYDVIDYGVTGYGATSYGITGYDVTDYAVTGYGITDRIVAPSYGGTGVGNVAVAGELPVRGSAAVAGQVPIIGAVWFEGPVRAAGSVTISGRCDCGLETRHCGCQTLYKK